MSMTFWEDARSQIEAELGVHEKLLWAGQPRQGILFRSTDLLLIPFSIMWGGFAIFWETMALLALQGQGGMGLLLALWGIPFVLVGLYMMIGRFLHDAWNRKRTYYGVTNERVIIISGRWRRKVQSLELRMLGNIELQTKNNGTGTIIFGPSGMNFSGMTAFPLRMNFFVPGSGVTMFEMIDDPRRVHELIRDAQHDAQLDSRRPALGETEDQFLA